MWKAFCFLFFVPYLCVCGMVWVSASNSSGGSSQSATYFGFVGDQNGNVWSCPISASGDVGTCAATFSSWTPNKVAVTSLPAGYFTYVADYNNNAVIPCSISASTGSVS